MPWTPITYEINCGELLPYVAPAQQLFQDNVRAIVQTTLVQAAARATTSYGTDLVTGRIGYFDDGLRTTDADGNPSAVPSGYPSVPLLHQLTQTPYDVSPTDYFRDLSSDLGRSLQRVTPSTLTTALPHLDTLVVADQHVTNTAAVKAFVAAGGNLVLTDSALTSLPSLGVGTAGQVQRRLAYVGYADLDRTHPFTRGLASNARQTYDPVSLGYPLLMERDGYWTCPPTDAKCTSGTHNSAPVWSLPASALPAGSQVVGTVDPPATPTTTREGSATDQAEIAVIPAGRGRIVTFGALLPHPTEAYPHYYGLQGYSISYAGQQMLLRALTYSRALTSATGVMPQSGGGPHTTSPRTTPGLALPGQRHLATTGAPGGVAAGAFLVLVLALGAARWDRRRLARH